MGSWIHRANQCGPRWCAPSAFHPLYRYSKVSSDLADGGAHHFAETIRKIKQKAPHILVEALTGDYAGSMEHVALVAKSGLDVYAHNVETSEEMTPFVRDRRATFRQSLAVLKHAKEQGVRITKTSIMLGVGETEDQIMRALQGEHCVSC